MKNKHHIIPKFILHQHATRPNGFEKHHFWMHNTQSTKDKFVPADSQCQKYRLYELQNAEHEIVPGTENVIENILATFEKKTAPIIYAIERNELLSEAQKAALALFTAIQIMRTPEAIAFCASFMQQHCPQLTPCQSQQLARIQGLLIRSELQDNKTLKKVLEWLCGYRMVIWRSPRKNAFIINQNRPVGVFMPVQESLKHAIVTYPISSTHCIAFVHDNHKREEMYITVLSEWVDLLNYYHYTNKATLVYCKYRVTWLPFYKRLILNQHSKD